MKLFKRDKYKDFHGLKVRVTCPRCKDKYKTKAYQGSKMSLECNCGKRIDINCLPAGEDNFSL